MRVVVVLVVVVVGGGAELASETCSRKLHHARASRRYYSTAQSAESGPSVAVVNLRRTPIAQLTRQYRQQPTSRPCCRRCRALRAVSCCIRPERKILFTNHHVRAAHSSELRALLAEALP